jgi:hypothetical protein
MVDFYNSWNTSKNSGFFMAHMFPVILKVKNAYFLKQHEPFGFVTEKVCVVCDVTTGFLNIYLTFRLQMDDQSTNVFW